MRTDAEAAYDAWRRGQATEAALDAMFGPCSDPECEECRPRAGSPEEDGK